MDESESKTHRWAWSKHIALATTGLGAFLLFYDMLHSVVIGLVSGLGAREWLQILVLVTSLLATFGTMAVSNWSFALKKKKKKKKKKKVRVRSKQRPKTDN